MATTCNSDDEAIDSAAKWNEQAKPTHYSLNTQVSQPRMKLYTYHQRHLILAELSSNVIAACLARANPEPPSAVPGLCQKGQVLIDALLSDAAKLQARAPHSSFPPDSCMPRTSQRRNSLPVSRGQTPTYVPSTAQLSSCKG